MYLKLILFSKLFLGVVFDKVTDIIDFYVINVINFNECSDEFICGTTPIGGNATAIYTMVLKHFFQK